jgi:multiple sugar transport system substrate-binding protein
MKKWAVAFLFLVFALPFTWAGGQKEAQEVSLEWMQWMYGDDAKIYANQITEFEQANPKINVKITEFSYSDHYSNLEVRMAGGNAPDIFRNEYGFLMRYEKNKQAVDLKPHFPKDYWKRFWPKLMEFCDIKGGVYGVPQMTDTTVVFYNQDLFKKAGLRRPRA